MKVSGFERALSESTNHGRCREYGGSGVSLYDII